MILSEPHQTAASVAKLVIRPYPAQYVRGWNLADGTPERIGGRILAENYVMQHICRKQGFTLRYDPLEDAIEATIELRSYS